MMTVAFTGLQVLCGALAIFALIATSILLVRRQLNLAGRHLLEQQLAIAGGGSRTKYGDVDVFRWRSTILAGGMAAALALVVLFFNWTTFSKSELSVSLLPLETPDIMITPPVLPPKKELPPPVIPQKIETTKLEDVPAIDFLMPNLDVNDAVVAPPAAETGPAVIPDIPPPPPVKDDAPWVVVEEMPLFPGCDEGTYAQRKKCADAKLMEFIKQHIRYPAIARDATIQGTVVVRFIVDKDGAIIEPTVIRDIGGQCGKEALRVVQLMQEQNIRWRPGRQMGHNVKVQFNLPVRFQLE